MSVFVMRERIDAIDSRLDKILDDEKLREHIKSVIHDELVIGIADAAIVAKNEIDTITNNSISRINENKNDSLVQQEEFYLKFKEEVRNQTNSSIEEHLRPVVGKLNHHNDGIKYLMNRSSLLPALFGAWTFITILSSVFLSYWII